MASDRVMGKWEESLRNGSETSHTSLAGKPAAARVHMPTLQELQTPWGGCCSHFFMCQLLRVTLLERENEDPERLRHLPPKTQPASRRARGSGRSPEVGSAVVKSVDAGARPPGSDPTTHWLCGPWATCYTSSGLIS